MLKTNKKAISVLMTIGFSAAAAMLGVGCTETAAPSQANAPRGDVTDVRPIPTAMAAAYQPPVYDSTAPIPTAPQPVTADTAYTVSPQPAITPLVSTNPTAWSSKRAKTLGERTHTVVHGETLFSIARNNYGDGKKWKQIVAANPGVSPSKLKVGQVLVMPSAS